MSGQVAPLRGNAQPDPTLTQHDSGSLGEGAPPPSGFRWAKRIGALVAVWLASWGFFALDDGAVHQPGLLAGVVLAAFVVIWGAQGVAPFATATDWTTGYVSSQGPTGHDPRFSRLSRLLGEAPDRLTVSDEIHRTLRALAVERLARLHDVDLDTQPEQAKALLGNELFRYVSQPARRMRGNEAAHLSRLVSRIEAL
jgi:hypothetical protein